MLTDAARDLRQAARALARRPVFLLSSVLTLALGLGAAVATFAVFDRVLWQPLSYPDAGRLVFVSGVLTGDGGPGASLSFREMADITERSRAVSAIAGYADSRPLEVLADSGPQSAHVNFIGAAYLDVLGARAARGRLLGEADNVTPGAHPVAVVSDAFWRAHLGGRPDVVGRSLRVGDVPYTVVGVMDGTFRDVPFESGETPTDIWLPSTMSLPVFGPTFLSSRSARVVWGVGRLADGVTLEQARAELGGIATDIEREFPDTNRRVGWHVEALDLWLFRDARTPFLVVLLGAFALLAVAALNVTGLLVARMAEHSRDLAVRRALGASTAQVIRPSLAEGLWLGALAAGIGAVVATGLLAFVRSSAPYAFPRLAAIGFDGRAAVALAGLALLAVATMTGAAACLARRRGHVGAGASRSVTSDRLTLRLQRGLVAGEVALAMVLLVGSVLVVRSLSSLERAPLGFDPDRLMTTTVELRGERYIEDARVAAFGQAVLDDLRAVTGIESAFLWGPGRPGRDTWISYILPEAVVDTPDPERVMVWRHNVSAGALGAAGIPILRGREFRATDRGADPFVAVISESMANRFWPGQDPVGQRFSYVTTAARRPWFQVIGVAGDAQHRHRRYSLTLPNYDYYQFFDQRPERTLTIVTRATRPPADIVTGVRESVARVDSTLPIRQLRTMADHTAEEEQSFRFAATLLSGFAALTFLLSATGLAVLIGYLMALRARELALRRVLGATRTGLFGGLVAGGLRLGLVGIVLGLVAARAGAQWLGTLLFGVDPHAPVVYFGTGIAMVVIVAVATALPAMRVRRIDARTMLRDI